MTERKIIQITGEAGAGKTEVCAYLAATYDFHVVLVSDIIRSFAHSRQLALGQRGDYLTVHAQMKKELGSDIIAKTILDMSASRVAVDGIRVSRDVERLRTASDVASLVVALDCPAELRFARAMHRKAPRDRLTYREFLDDDRQDGYSPDPEHQNTRAVMESADYHIDASQPRAVVCHAIDAVVGPLLDA